MTNELKRGMYVRTKNIRDTEQWKAVIQAFEGAGFSSEYEGYRFHPSADNYTTSWGGWYYVGIDEYGDIVHYDKKDSYGTYAQEVSVEYILGVEAEKFAVGDVVEATGNMICLAVKVGTRGVITEILPSGNVTISFGAFEQVTNLAHKDFIKVDPSEASCTSHVDTLNDTLSVGIQEDVESLVGSPEMEETKPKIRVTAETTYTLTIQGNVLILNEQEFVDLHRALEAI